MGNHAVLYQSPRPEIKIYKPDNNEKPILEFDTAKKSILQSYTFGTSINDQKGKFTLTFHPNDEETSIGKEGIIDQIEILDVVEIYEYKGSSLEREVIPTFVGVIREKKYTAQFGDNGVKRILTISGHSIVGLIHEFIINFDMRVMVMRTQAAANKAVQDTFNLEFNKKDDLELKKLDYVIKKIWEHFILLSKGYKDLATLKIHEYLEKWIGGANEIFEIDTKTKFHHPIGSIFNGNSTQTFYDVIANIVPKPLYEIFPYMDFKNGKMRMKIREIPFDMDIWHDSEKIKITPIDPKLVKSFDVKQNDNEVYTVFFSYLRNSAIQHDLAFKLAAQEFKECPGIEVDGEKFQKYGYRPLLVTFNGFPAEGDTVTPQNIQELNKRLKEWFGEKEKMYSGTISMETNLAEDMPQPGERIAFLDGEFYVVDSEHNWSYGVAPETKITLERGGDYSLEKFSVLNKISKRYQEFESCIVNQLGAF